jgi:membrane protein
MRTWLKLPERGPSSAIIRVLLGAVVGWFNDRAIRLAASLSFFTMLSLGPLLLITLQIVGVLLGPEAAAGQLEAYLRQMVGPRGAEVLQEIVAEAGRDERGYLATAFSVGILVFTASYVFAELQDAMNTVWNVKTAEGWAVWQIVRNRLIAFGMVLSLAFLLLVSLVISTILTALTTYFFPEPDQLVQLVDSIVSLLVISTVFALLFKFVPDTHIRWSDVWPAALLSGVLFTIGQFVLALYLGRAVAVSLYGAAGSLVALLLWVYYSAMILFFGAEITKSYMDWRRGRSKNPEQALEAIEAAKHAD